MGHMENKNTIGTSVWLKRFNNAESSEDQLPHTENTAQSFCDAVGRISIDTSFEREPNKFYVLLHELAPGVLKNE
jgi:hypothetical protein